MWTSELNRGGDVVCLKNGSTSAIGHEGSVPSEGDPKHFMIICPPSKASNKRYVTASRSLCWDPYVSEGEDFTRDILVSNVEARKSFKSFLQRILSGT